MCMETVGPTSEDGLFLPFHHIPCESHVYIHFVSIHSGGSTAFILFNLGQILGNLPQAAGIVAIPPDSAGVTESAP